MWWTTCLTGIIFDARTMPANCLLWRARLRREWCQQSWPQWSWGCGRMGESRAASTDPESISSMTLPHSKDSVFSSRHTVGLVKLLNYKHVNWFTDISLSTYWGQKQKLDFDSGKNSIIHLLVTCTENRIKKCPIPVFTIMLLTTDDDSSVFQGSGRF